MTKQKDLAGINGWLILVAIGVIVSPVRLGYLVASTYPDIFSDGTWEALTTVGSAAYHPFWQPLLTGEIIINGALILASLYLAYLFFTKQAAFPRWFIGIAVFSLAFIFADAFAVKMVLPAEPVFDPDTVREVMRAGIMVAVWVPYMLVSKRVKATFVKANNNT